ncbi:hypothetical protein [Paraburkholderia dipogonis]|uniref:hypothetical protein n=1 Tax=Paraburkholderia dipogonis TaxID=1211383 RepID=UPI0038BD9258
MKTRSLFAAVLFAASLTTGAHAAKPAKPVAKDGPAGPVCDAAGTLAHKMAENRDVGITEEKAREISGSKITVIDTTDADRLTHDLITMVYHDPQVKDSDPINAQIRGSQICVRQYGPRY